MKTFEERVVIDGLDSSQHDPLTGTLGKDGHLHLNLDEVAAAIRPRIIPQNWQDSEEDITTTFGGSLCQINRDNEEVTVNGNVLNLKDCSYSIVEILARRNHLDRHVELDLIQESILGSTTDSDQAFWNGIRHARRLFSRAIPGSKLGDVILRSGLENGKRTLRLKKNLPVDFSTGEQ